MDVTDGRKKHLDVDESFCKKTMVYVKRFVRSHNGINHMNA